ncbi:hypothetical protein H4R20_004596 [Coemansia guatemalensis]|uniref:Uncharacterized protein n=1 Tax=Coemansia guatemalensis TaxID=2761395 RepID=A0A9W8HXA8_9FUNG|nr:hypothetical protein H4R20_004596 [Coemansia guatemalensis]
MSRIIGKAEESLGRLTDNPRLEAKGHERRVHARNKKTIANDPAAYLDRVNRGAKDNYDVGPAEDSRHYQVAGQQDVPQRDPDTSQSRHAPRRDVAGRKEAAPGYAAEEQAYGTQERLDAHRSEHTPRRDLAGQKAASEGYPARDQAYGAQDRLGTDQSEKTRHRDFADQREAPQSYPIGRQAYGMQRHTDAGPASHTRDYTAEDQGSGIPASRLSNPSPGEVYEVQKDAAGYNDREKHGYPAAGQPTGAYDQRSPAQFQHDRGQSSSSSGMSSGISKGMGIGYEMKGSAQRKLGKAIGNPNMEQRGRERQKRGKNERTLAEQGRSQQHSV